VVSVVWEGDVVIEAEWLGGPNDGDVLALPDDTHEVPTLHPGKPFDWVKENTEFAMTEIEVRSHRVVFWHGKWRIVW